MGKLKAITGAVEAQDQRDSTSGFRAQLDGVTLWDLVQLECLAGSRKTVRVHSPAGEGYLYFERGQLVHAARGDLEGDAAVLDVLGWTGGEVSPCDKPWPGRRTVQTSWQSLLMQAAQRHDERSAGAPARTRRPDGNSGVVVIDAVADKEQRARQSDAPICMNTNGNNPAPPANANPALPPQARANQPQAEFARAATLDARGDVVDLVGDADELAGQAAYTMRLAEIVGDALALGPLIALEAQLPPKDGSARKTCVFACRDAGGIVVYEPHNPADAARHRRELGL